MVCEEFKLSKKSCFSLIVIILFLSFFTIPLSASDKVPLKGKGTIETPYLIESLNDLTVLRDLVNEGYNFKNCYFRQTKNIDMNNQQWIPIGTEQNYFCGTYDGNGHFIKNVLIQYDDNQEEDYCALFSYFGGTIANLGIESGRLFGTNCASIAGCIMEKDAAILNCYNKATLNGTRSGGIACYFSEGIIVGCWNAGILNGEQIAGIISEGGDVKLYACYSTYENIAPTDVVSTTSYWVSEKDLFSESFAKRLSFEAGLEQYLFANKYNVELHQWKFSDDILSYSSAKNYIHLFYFINYYLLLCILVLVVAVYLIKFIKTSSTKRWVKYASTIHAILIIAGCLIPFLDLAVFTKGIKVLKIGNSLFIILVNILFLGTLLLTIKNTKIKIPKIRKNKLPILTLIVIVIILELLQFNILPKYDACFYYGSLMKACELFQLDLLTYIGAFVCWKWAHGIAIFLAPLEYIFPGNGATIYWGNMIITIITIICLYKLINEIFVDILPLTNTLCCAIFIFCPYGLGLFTYFNMDWQITYFAVWLLYCVKEKNNLLISFCGYLLAFTKITGLIFYVFVLITVGIYELYLNQNKNILKKIYNCFPVSKIFLWILPALLFMIAFLFGDHFTIQNFYGTYVSESMISLKSMQIVGNTLMQTFVFGFRWIFTLSILFLLIFCRKKTFNSLTVYGKMILLALVVAIFFVLFILCIYNSDAECPRYTSIFNLFFTLMFALTAQTIFNSKIIRNTFLGIMTVLLCIQTYWTIDPAISLFSPKSIDTGKILRYKLATSKDSRSGMNLGIDYGKGIEVLGDLYTYNFEYTFYDDLLQKTLIDINPTKKDTFYVLDIIDYELHLCGSANRNYKIYWNARTKKRTYNNKDKDSIYLNEKSITTQELKEKNKKELDLPNNFYVIVASRVDETEAIKALEKRGYQVTYELHPENIYGTMSVYGFEN